MSERYKKAEENTALYTAHVLHQYGWGTDRLRQHWNWSGKDCPHKMRAHNGWGRFVKRVQEHLSAIKKGQNSSVKKAVKKAVKKVTPKKTVKKTVAKVPSKKAVKQVKQGRYERGWHWSGTFQANTTIAVRRGNRGMNMPLVAEEAWIKKGQWVNFDHLFYKNGMWWIRFKYAAKGSSSNYFFMPVGERNPKVNFTKTKLWGTVSNLNTNEKTSGVLNWHKKGAVKK